MPTTKNNFIELLASSKRPKRWIERKIAEIAHGVVAAIRDGSLPADRAWEELFNLENYEAVRRIRLHRDIRDLFEWGMELDSVARIAPHGLSESLDAMSRINRRVIERSQPPATRRQSNPVTRIRRAG